MNYKRVLWTYAGGFSPNSGASSVQFTDLPVVPNTAYRVVLCAGRFCCIQCVFRSAYSTPVGYEEKDLNVLPGVINANNNVVEFFVENPSYINAAATLTADADSSEGEWGTFLLQQVELC